MEKEITIYYGNNMKETILKVDIEISNNEAIDAISENFKRNKRLGVPKEALKQDFDDVKDLLIELSSIVGESLYSF